MKNNINQTVEAFALRQSRDVEEKCMDAIRLGPVALWVGVFAPEWIAEESSIHYVHPWIVTGATEEECLTQCIGSGSLHMVRKRGKDIIFGDEPRH